MPHHTGSKVECCSTDQATTLSYSLVSDNMEPALNQDTVALWFHKYLFPATQHTKMPAGDTTLSPFAEPFIPRDPESSVWPADRLDTAHPDLACDPQTVLPVQNNDCVRAMANGMQHPSRRPIGYERAQTHRRRETESRARDACALGFRGAHVENASEVEIATGFLEGLQGGVATLTGGDFYRGQYTVFSGVSLWNRVTSTDLGSSDVAGSQCSTHGETSNSSSVGLSSDKDTSGNSDNSSSVDLSSVKDTSGNSNSSSVGLSSDKDTSDSHSCFVRLSLQKDTCGNSDNSSCLGLSSDKDTSQTTGSECTEDTSAAPFSLDSDTERRTSSSTPNAADQTYSYPRPGDPGDFTFPLSSLDLLTIKDPSSSAPMLSCPKCLEKSSPTCTVWPPTIVAVHNELETMADNALHLPFPDDSSHSLNSSDGRSLTSRPARGIFSYHAKHEDVPVSPSSVSSQISRESACHFHVGWTGQCGSRFVGSPPLSPQSGTSACSNRSVSDDGQLPCSAACRHSQQDLSSDGRSSVDSGIGASVSDHVYVTADVKDGSGESSQGHRATDARLCPEHPDKRQNLYCAHCLRLICSLCFAAYHMDCTPVLTPDRACRAVRWQLVKLQSSVDMQIVDLERRASALRGRLDSSARWAGQCKDLLNDQFRVVLSQLEDKRRQLLCQIDAALCESSSPSALRDVERGLLILNYVSKFVEVLRHRDSAWELLTTFDLPLSQLLERVLCRTATRASFESPAEFVHERFGLDQCQLTALEIALQSLGLQSKVLESRTRSLGDEAESSTFVGRTENEDRCARDIDSSASRSSDGQRAEDDDRLLSEVLSYLNRFPPPAAFWRRSGSTESSASSHHEDLDDDVFESEAGSNTGMSVAKGDEGEQSSHATADAPPSKEYRLQQRLCPDFLQDRRKSFITDIHVTETGQLVLLDAANDCLKRVDPRTPSSLARRVQVTKPLCLCSAGWERVLISCAGRALELYSVGGLHVRLLAHRSTQRQYVGITRASDALVAAACPETHSIDLLDFSGRLLRSVMPVCFDVGPKVVGATASGHLLAVHQPAKPPTAIVCFDMSGRVIWKHELHVRDRHVVCSKVIGTPDGHVIFGLQEQSTLYSFSPTDGITRVLMTPRHGIKFPSGLAQDGEGRLFIARSDLQRQPLTLITSEVDVYGDVTALEVVCK